MDQRGFAEALGVSAGSLAQWETDRTKPRGRCRQSAKRVELLTPPRLDGSWAYKKPPPDPWGQTGVGRCPQ
ncbi:hypothetical protein GS924_06695 [Rhodococcus hoagii]|nr:hypothetical protein [Prescottella equi]